MYARINADIVNTLLSLVNDLRTTESEPSKMHNVRPSMFIVGHGSPITGVLV